MSNSVNQCHSVSNLINLRIINLVTGLLYELLRRMIKPERISFNRARTKFAKAPPVPSNSTGNVTITMPTMIKKNVNDPCEIKVHHSKGPAYVAKRNRMKPLTQLGLSFINGGQIIGLTLILTVISGVFIWILVSVTIVVSVVYHL